MLIRAITMLNFEQYPLFIHLESLPSGSWEPKDIKFVIRKIGVILAEPFTKREVAIAEYLNVLVQLLFPTGMRVDKKSVKPRYANKYTTVAELLS